MKEKAPSRYIPLSMAWYEVAYFKLVLIQLVSTSRVALGTSMGTYIVQLDP